MNEITKQIANNLVSARKNAGLSQQKLAEALGVHQNTVAFWESQRNEIPTDQLLKVAKLLKAGNWLWFYQDNTPQIATCAGSFVPAARWRAWRASRGGTSVGRSRAGW